MIKFNTNHKKKIASRKEGVGTNATYYLLLPIFLCASLAFAKDPFYIYKEFHSRDNHFAPSGWMGDYGDLRLDEAAAVRTSPVFLPPATRAPVMTCVGGDESSEFKRQNALLRDSWKGTVSSDIAMPGKHHFSVLDGLATPASALFAGARRLMQLDR